MKESMKEVSTRNPRPSEFQDTFKGIPRWILAVALNILILGELTWCMYWSHGAGQDMAAVFLKSFVPMVLSTLFLGRLLMRKLSRG
ncbi:MAG: hypothetical protein WHX93_07600 [bacterium]